MLRRTSRATPGLALVLLVAAAVQADISTGLVGYRPADSNALDVSGNELHGSKPTSSAEPIVVERV